MHSHQLLQPVSGPSYRVCFASIVLSHCLTPPGLTFIGSCDTAERRFISVGFPPHDRADLERFLRRRGGVVDELLRELEETSLQPPEVARRAQLEGALIERQAERQRLLRVFLKGTISENEFEAERAEIDTAIGTLQNALSELDPPEAPDYYIDVAAADVLEQLNRLLDEGLTDEQWQEVARILIKRVTVHTTISEDGKKEVRAEVTYRFPGSVPTNPAADS